MLIIVCGLPGSGKSTLARALSKELKAGYISSDITRKKMFKEPTYSEDEKAAVYDEMAGWAENSLRSGKNTIVDATFYVRKQRKRFGDIARNAGTQVYVIVCSLDEKDAETRLKGRWMGGPSDADYSVYLKLKEKFEPVEGAHLELNTSLPKDEIIKHAMEYLRR